MLTTGDDQVHLIVAVRGLTNSFGVFETYYSHTYLPMSNPSAISWIGSIQLFLTMLVGVFAGWFLDAGHLRILLLVGTFLEVFGMFMTSLSTTYWQILLAQGICVGLGSGLLGLTSVAVIPLYFSKKRMIATGIAATGSSLGKLRLISLSILVYGYHESANYKLQPGSSTRSCSVDSSSRLALHGLYEP